MKTVTYMIEVSRDQGKTWMTWTYLNPRHDPGEWLKSLPGDAHRGTLVFRLVKRTAVITDEVLAEEPQKDVVIFRQYMTKGVHEGQVIALFPQIKASGALFTCFGHAGQHGSADYDLTMRLTRPATEAEYAALKKELESAPYYYRLDVRKRRPHG